MVRGTRVDLTICQDQPPRLYVAPDLAASLNIGPGSSDEVLHFGKRSLAVTVTVTATLAPGAAEMTRLGAHSLRLPQPARLHMYRTGSRHLRLGPLIGVYISDEKLAALQDGMTDSIYLRLQRYADEIGACLIFVTADGIDARRKLADAYQFRKERLQPVQVPLPRVLYDRCFGTDSRADAYWVRSLAAAEGLIVVNNPVKLTKMASAEAIAGDPALHGVVPYFRPLTAASLEEAAAQFDDVYVKPDNLSKGRGVCRVHRDGETWVLEQTGPEGPYVQTHASADEVIRQLPSDIPYLVQEGLDLATYMGNRYDFRALVQKDGTGGWQLTGLVARIAPAAGVITSPRSGGQVSPALRALEHSFGPGPGRQLLYDLTRTCLRIAARVEEVYGLCSELGLDLGVTRHGHIRLIEVNARPLKVSLNRLRDPVVHTPIVRQPVNFAASLDLRDDVVAGAGR